MDVDDPEREQPAAELLPVIYEELRRLARGKMSREHGPQTLSATALVHEAWVRVSGPEGREPVWRSRRHFFGAAAEAMRRILIERARSKGRIKHGGTYERVAVEYLDEVEIATPMLEQDVLAVDEALARLMAEDPLAGEIVSLRYFAGLKWSEIAEMVGLSEREVGRQWEYARAWLHAEMTR